MDIGQIYCLTSPSGKMYVGQCVKIRPNNRHWGYMERWKNHVREALSVNTKKGCTYLNRAILKYGANTFNIELLEECDITEIDSKEKYYIQILNTLAPHGYNLTSGGQGSRNLSDVTRMKLSIIAKKRIVTDSTREKMRQSHIGLKHKEETKIKISQIFKGKPKVQKTGKLLPKYICFLKCDRGYSGYTVRIPGLKTKVFRSGPSRTLSEAYELAENYLNTMIKE